MRKAFTVSLALAAALAFVTEPRAQQGPRIKTLTEQEAIDMAVGTGIQGTRSNDTEAAIRQVRANLAAGKQYKLVSMQDLPDDWTIVTAAGGIGGGAPWEHVVERTKKQNLPTIPNATVAAMEALSKHLGKKFNAVLRNEAAGATLNAFNNAMAFDLPVVDACPAGRAKPEVQQSLTFISGLSVTPAALVTRWGDTIIVDKTVDDYRYEDIARSVAIASGGGVSNARGVMSGRDVKRVTIHGQVSEAILFGKTVREAAAAGKDPVAELTRVAKGYPLFQGTVTKAERNGERGFTWWDVELKGTKGYTGHTYRVWVKNENIITWLDGKPDVMSPDLIYNLDPKTGRAMTSSGLGGYDIGAEAALIGRAALHPGFRSPKGIEVLGPRHFGFDMDYRPIEEFFKSRQKFTTE